ncbi:hypothetical protein EAS54_36860 [Bradyrhizobium guangzhouense]|nr:hypothetical protein XH91_35370 [Bradyrhizobium guangzhouense]RXH07975.1 hypothetical protein EAS54_36860 [Bradyrhizobium guangzhouense]
MPATLALVWMRWIVLSREVLGPYIWPAFAGKIASGWPPAAAMIARRAERDHRQPRFLKRRFAMIRIKLSRQQVHLSPCIQITQMRSLVLRAQAVRRLRAVKARGSLQRDGISCENFAA